METWQVKRFLHQEAAPLLQVNHFSVPLMQEDNVSAKWPGHTTVISKLNKYILRVFSFHIKQKEDTRAQGHHHVSLLLGNH